MSSSTSTSPDAPSETAAEPSDTETPGATCGCGHTRNVHHDGCRVTGCICVAFARTDLGRARDEARAAGVEFGFDIRRDTPHVGSSVVFLVIVEGRAERAFILASTRHEQNACVVAKSAAERRGVRIECHYLG